MHGGPEFGETAEGLAALLGCQVVVVVQANSYLKEYMIILEQY